MNRRLACVVLAIALVMGGHGRAWAGESGEQVFRAHCDACHAFGGVGAITLIRTLGVQNALLEDRKGFVPDYIRYVVRSGRKNMPPLTRVELTDEELDEIVRFLTKTTEAS